MPQVQREHGWRYGDFVSPLPTGTSTMQGARILEKAGYDGDLCLEDESQGRFPKQEGMTCLLRDADHFRGVLGRVALSGWLV